MFQANSFSRDKPTSPPHWTESRWEEYVRGHELRLAEYAYPLFASILKAVYEDPAQSVFEVVLPSLSPR